jgi:hypothetical protein
MDVPEVTEPSEEPSKETELKKHPSITNPLAIINGQSWFFWANKGDHNKSQRPALDPRASQVSQLTQVSCLTDELSEGDEEVIEGGDERCGRCGGGDFEVATRGVGLDRVTVCKKCRAVVE